MGEQPGRVDLCALGGIVTTAAVMATIRLHGEPDLHLRRMETAADGDAGAIDELVDVAGGSAAEGATLWGRWAAFPPPGGSGRVDGDVALQLAFDGGDVDGEVVEDAPGAASRVECEHREQVFGADLWWRTVAGAGCRAVRGGIERTGCLGRHRRDLVARRVAGWAEQTVRRVPDRIGVHADAFEDGCGDAFGQQVLGACLC